MGRRALSLYQELAMLRGAIEAARILTDHLGTEQFATPDDRRKAPHAITSVLTLAGERMRNLGRAIDGQLDPRILLGEHNDASLHVIDGHDVTLAERSPEDSLRVAKENLRRAERRLRSAEND